MPTSRIPVTALISAGVFLIGIASAIITPYLAIAAIDGLGMSNSLFALVMTLGSLGSAAASLLLGYFADRIPDRRLLVVICAAMGALGYGLIYLFPTQFTYILVFCLILPFGGALFSQSLAFSRVYFDLHHPGRSQFLMSVMRTLVSLAWVVVPPLAGWVASSYSVLSVFAATALAYAGCGMVFGLLYADSGARIGSVKQAGSQPVIWHISKSRLVGIAGVTLVRVAIALHTTVLPLAMVKDFGGSLKDVGFNAAVAAGLEIPFMLAWGLAATRFSKEAILVVNAILYALYLLLLFFADSVREVLWLQGLNAISIAALLIMTIGYMQEAIKGRVGLSTSLLSVVTVVSTFTASALFNALASKDSYIALFIAASILCFVGAGIIALSRSPLLMNEGATKPG